METSMSPHWPANSRALSVNAKVSSTLALACLLMAILFTSTTLAEEGPNAPQYVHLQPAFVLNYGSNTTGRLKYVRTDVALRVIGAAAAGKVNHHQPYIRNQLVLLLSQQEDEIINSTQGREKLRQTALQEIRALLTELEGQPFVEDLFFQNFVAQN